MPSFAVIPLRRYNRVDLFRHMGEPSPETPTSDKPSEDRLDSWKAIAAYLGRDVTTVQRWEKREAMPVHRHLHDKRGSVYALPQELDAWLKSRRQELGDEPDERDKELKPGPVEAEGAGRIKVTRRFPTWLALTGVAVLGLLAAAYALSHGRTRDAEQPKISSLAVLPLKNLSGDPTQEYLSDGMTEALIGRLASMHGLRVISRTSVMRFKNPQLSVPEIAKMLRVDAIVEGSVMREGNRIRVTAQLIRGATDTHFWSETYDRELKDVFAVQAELAQSIAEKVQVTVTGEEHARLTAARSVAPEVYESYLKGRFVYDTSNTRAAVEESIAYFDRAIQLDPTFAPAYVGLGVAYNDLGTVSVGAPPEEMRPKAASAARKALVLDPDFVEAHVLLADVLQEQFHWADAEAEYRRALQLSPNNADAHAGLAFWLLSQGRTDEAMTWEQRGRELDPISISGANIAWILFQSHRFDQAIHELHSALAVDPNETTALSYLGFALVANNQPAEAIPVLEKAISVSNGSPAAIGVLIRAYAHAGRRADALRLLTELQKRKKAGYVPAAAFVNAYLGLGETDQAFAWLEQAYKEQSNILQFLKVHPYFDPIRADPRFVDLVRRVGLN
ncbi:MAG: tetratricopeptide repeat protein [Bryobacteraceae bacterium]|jgi:TolB-like protein/Tfp pilus assembly protein PilF